MEIQEDRTIDLKREFFLVYLIKTLICLTMKIARFKCKNQKSPQLELLCGKNLE